MIFYERASAVSVDCYEVHVNILKETHNTTVLWQVEIDDMMPIPSSSLGPVNETTALMNNLAVWARINALGNTLLWC